jgi:hypothetical protein
MDSDWHRDLMGDLIETVKDHWREQPRIYVSGNPLVYYEPGNRRRRVSPDVFVVRGVANHLRPNFLLWDERRGPQVAIELTSSKTRREENRESLLNLPSFSPDNAFRHRPRRPRTPQR